MFEYLSRLIGARHKAERICCFHFGRCGSTLLGNMLQSHPQIEWAGELFHAHHERKDRSVELRPFELLKNRIAHSAFRHFGFETKFQHLDSNGLQLDLEAYLLQLNKLGFRKFIVLKRNNYLRQAISVARGQISSMWHVPIKDMVPETEPLYLDTVCVSLGGRNRSILDCFQFLDQSYSDAMDTLRRLSFCLCELCYEEHLQEQPLEGYRLVMDFIRVPYVRPEISVRKLESRPVNQIVSNFDELVRCLKGTKHEWMCYH
jgi:hypothetical protein